MSSIPPNWLASGIQAQGSQQKTAEARDKDRSAAAQRISESRFATHIQEVIEGADRDGDVNPDAEGAGSQGRAPDDSDAPDSRAEPPAPAGDGGLDIQA